ncbi:MAG: sulfite exporter TauE/SafE family protein [Reyranella sp.]|nr:MAG: sulfite exporter TauE/SafE family protein [Reyranella sp.]
MPLDLLYICLGAGVGIVVGLTGVGGGSLMTPALVLLFGIHPVTAVGTDLLYAATTKSAGSIVHALRMNVAWRVVALLSLGSVPVAVATLVVLAQLGPQSGLMAKVVTMVLGGALLLTSILLVFRRWLLRLRGSGSMPNLRRDGLLTVATGAVIGLLVSVSSVGAGAIGVTALLMLYPAYPTVRIVGTDIAHAVPLTLVAGLGHWLAGSVDLSMLLSLLAGSIPGIVLGSYLAPRVPERGLRLALAGVLMVVGVKLLAS